MEIFKVVVTGPESTGKTSLANELASRYGTVFIPEYAREYINGLGRKYTRHDVEHIAMEQVRLEKHYLPRAGKILFYDTWLIITKVWFRVVYGDHPAWIDRMLKESSINLFLVCNTDIPWLPDPVRENGGEMRERLLGMYMQEIDALGVPRETISGSGKARTDAAIGILNKYLKKHQIGI